MSILYYSPVARRGKKLPISNVVVHRDLIYISGQFPQFKSNTKEESIYAQTFNVFERIDELLKSIDSELDKLLKVNVWITDKSLYGDFNKAYEEIFAGRCSPARTTVVSVLIPPVKIEVDAVAVL